MVRFHNSLLNLCILKENEKKEFLADIETGVNALAEAGVSKKIVDEFLHELLENGAKYAGDLDAIDELMRSKFTPQQMIELNSMRFLNGKKI